MADKILKETLIALDLEESKKKGRPLSFTTLKWIKEHGLPDINSVFKKQRQQMDFLSRRDCEALIKDTAEACGILSPKNIKACIKVYQNGISLTQIANWLGIKKGKIKDAMNHFDDYCKVQSALKSGYYPDEEYMIKIYYQLSQKGISFYKLGEWSGLDARKIKRRVQSFERKVE